MNTKAQLLKTLIREEVRRQMRLIENESEDPNYARFRENPENGMYKGLKALGKSNLMKLRKSLNIVMDSIPQRYWGTNSGAGIQFNAPTGEKGGDWGSDPNIIFYMHDLSLGGADWWKTDLAQVQKLANINFGSVNSYFDGRPRNQKFIVSDSPKFSQDPYYLAGFNRLVDAAIQSTTVK